MVTITSHCNPNNTTIQRGLQILQKGTDKESFRALQFIVNSVGIVPRQRLLWFPSSSLEYGPMPTEENLLRPTEQPVSPTKTPPDRDHRIYGSHRYIYVRFQDPPIKASHSLIRPAVSLNSPSSPNQSTSKTDRRKASLASCTRTDE